jgi:hypothetical protein
VAEEEDGLKHIRSGEILVSGLRNLPQKSLPASLFQREEGFFIGRR